MKWLAAAAAAVFSVVQLVPGTVRDNPPTSTEMPAPPVVRRILRRSCYDCHSNETWDVREGRMRMVRPEEVARLEAWAEECGSGS